MKQPDHDYHETLFDRDDRPIQPTCAYCGKPKTLCQGGAKGVESEGKIYRNPDVTPFIPGRGRILTVPKGEEPTLGEIIQVDFEGSLVQKRVVGLEFGTNHKTVGVIIRDLDFPDPNFWTT